MDPKQLIHATRVEPCARKPTERGALRMCVLKCGTRCMWNRVSGARCMRKLCRSIGSQAIGIQEPTGMSVPHSTRPVGREAVENRRKPSKGASRARHQTRPCAPDDLRTQKALQILRNQLRMTPPVRGPTDSDCKLMWRIVRDLRARFDHQGLLTHRVGLRATFGRPLMGRGRGLELEGVLQHR